MQGAFHGFEVVHAPVTVEEERFTESERSSRTPRADPIDDVVTSEIGGDVSIEVGNSNAHYSTSPHHTSALSEESHANHER
jgi:hypothetical protein